MIRYCTLSNSIKDFLSYNSFSNFSIKYCNSLNFNTVLKSSIKSKQGNECTMQNFNDYSNNPNLDAKQYDPDTLMQTIYHIKNMSKISQTKNKHENK